MSAPPIQTALIVGNQSAHKPLGAFGSKSIRKPVSEGRAAAELLKGEGM